MVQPSPISAPRFRGEGVETALRRDILTGRYQPGDRLPPERELALQLGTNRNTLREALRTLESQNLIQSRQGDGTIVVDWQRDGELSLLGAFLVEDTSPTLRLQALGTLMALRERLLGEVVELAATRATAADHAALADALDALRRSRPAEVPAADVELFRRLVLAAHDLVIAWIFNTFARTLLTLADRFPDAWRHDQPYLDALDRLLEQLRAGDGTRARATLRRTFHSGDPNALEALARQSTKSRKK